MAALASTDVTVTVNSRDREIAGAVAGKTMNIVTVTFGDGSKTYPANGVPLPAIGQFGFRKSITMGICIQNPDNGFVYKYDKTNHTIRIYTQGFTTGSTTATTPGNGALIEDSAAAETAARLPNTSVDTTYDFGPMKEMKNTIAPAAASIDILFIGE